MLKIISLSILIILIFQACGSVTRDGIYDPVSTVEYKQLNYKEDWVKNIRTSYSMSDVALDQNRNSYFVSNYRNILTLDKFDREFNKDFNKTYQFDNIILHPKIILDQEDNIYISSIVTDNMGNFDNYSMKLLKISPTGDIIWSKIKEFDKGYQNIDIAIDSKSNIYLLGYLWKNNSPDADRSNTILIKYSSNGKELWEKNLGLLTYGSGMGIGEDQKIYITGTVDNSIFLAKYSSNGDEEIFKKYKQGDNSKGFFNTKMSLGKDGYIYTSGSMDFYDRDENKTNVKFFVSKVNTNGQEKYFTTFVYDTNKDLNKMVHDLKSDIYGNIYIFGDYYDIVDDKNTVFLTELNPDGKIINEKFYNGYAYTANVARGGKLFIDEDNSIYIESAGYLLLNDSDIREDNFVLKLSPVE